MQTSSPLSKLFRVPSELVRANKLVSFLGLLFFREEETSRPTYEFCRIKPDDNIVRIISVVIFNVLSNVLFSVYLIVLTTLYVLAMSLVAIILRIKNDVKGYTSDEHFMKYLKIYWDRPGNFYNKLLEGLFFSRIDVRSPSIEIGLSAGHGLLVSDLHFSKAQFDVGTEYNVEELKSASMSDRHAYIIGLDAREMSIKDNVIQTICAVHSFDHFPQIDEALKECRRILKFNGRLVFSLSSKESPKTTFSFLFSQMIFPKEKAYAMAVNLKNRGFSYNFFSEHEWEKKLNVHGYRLLEYRTYLGGRAKYMLLLTSKFHRYGAIIILNKLSRRYSIAHNFMRKFFFFVNAGLFYPSFLKEINRKITDGRELFMVAEKC